MRKPSPTVRQPRLTAAEKKTIRDFWEVYEAHLDDLRREISPITRKFPIERERLRAFSEISRKLRRRAILRGQWKQYLGYLGEVAAEFARRDVGFDQLFELIGSFRAHILPHLWEAYGRAPERFLGAVRGMERFIDLSLVAVSEQYVHAKEEVIRLQRRGLEQRERRLSAQHEISRVLAESNSLEAAAPRILQTICETSGWVAGTLWERDREAGVLRAAQRWRAPGLDLGEFEAITFSRGLGLPGRAWEKREPIWISDVRKDPLFVRAAIAARIGLGGGAAFSICVGEEVAGVMEFFSRDVRSPDAELLQVFVTVGNQIGQFIERCRAAEDILRHRAAIRELSTPVLQVRERLLILPLVGAIGEHRARQIKDELLRAIRANRGRVVVIDLTGVPIIDSLVANHLVQTIEAARLLGANVIVTGISRGIAQTLVDIGFELTAIQTVGDLQGGIEEAERIMKSSAN